MAKLFVRIGCAFLLGLALALPATGQVALPKVLVLYDSTGSERGLGDLYQQMTRNLLSHFEVSVVTKPIEKYVTGDMVGCRAVLYLGVLYDNPIPSAFLRDVLANSTITVCWVNFNIHKIAGATSAYAASFKAKFGFQYLSDAEDVYAKFTYKNTTLSSMPHARFLALLQVLNPALATVKATAFNPAAPAINVPYIIQSGKFWYVADNPFIAEVLNDDHVLIFADLLHDILGITHPTLHRAFLRIEDVNASSDPALLRKVADTLYALKVPFAISVIPAFRDPLSVYPALPRSLDLDKAPLVAAAVRYMVARGGQVLMHGYSHQLDAVQNPINGVTGTDYEFILVHANPDTSQDVTGPVPQDSAAWCDGRLQAGIAILARAGLRPAGWLTPHYTASPLDYKVIATRFPICVERGYYYAASNGVLYSAMQTFPYIVRDVYGLKHIPETVGYIDTAAVPPQLPADMITAAQANLVVRDGWASGFFHWYMDPTMLPTIVNGLRAKGYTFAPIANYTR